jgi:hypothetical protein
MTIHRIIAVDEQTKDMMTWLGSRDIAGNVIRIDEEVYARILMEQVAGQRLDETLKQIVTRTVLEGGQTWTK